MWRRVLDWRLGADRDEVGTLGQIKIIVCLWFPTDLLKMSATINILLTPLLKMTSDGQPC